MRHTYYIAIIIILLIPIGYSISIIQDQQQRLHDKDTQLNEHTAEISYRKSKEGKLIADKLAAETRANDLATAYPALAQTISKEMDIKLKNLRLAMQAEFTAHGEGMSSITNNYYDSAGTKVLRRQLQFDDGYLGFHADLTSGVSKYDYTDTLTYAFNMCGRWWERKKLYGSGMLQNKQAKITGSTSVMVKEYKDKRWGIGPYIGYGVGRDGLQTNFGISIQYSLIKF